MKNSKITANLLYVSISFFLNESAYFALEGLQSSLNNEAGTQSLSALYSTYVLTSLFLPTLAMNYLQSRKAMAIATSAYVVYTIANFYPHWYTLIPAAVILGSSSSVLWSASRVYISDLADAYTRQNKKDTARITTKFFGIFFAIFSLSMVIGNVMSSIVFHLSENKNGITINETTNFSMHITSPNIAVASPLNNNSDIKSSAVVLTCGLNDCNQLANISREHEIIESYIEQTVLYGLFTAFAVIQIAAVLILLFPADDAPKQDHLYTITSHDSNEQEARENEQLYENSKRSTRYSVEIEKTPKKHSNKVTKQMFATARFILFNNSIKLLIPITLHVGMIQSFVFGRFMKHWVTCVLGISYVGYVAAAYGAGCVVGSYSVRIITKLAGRRAIMFCVFLMEIGIIAGLFVWEPDTASSTWLFFAVSGCLGIICAVNRTILTSCYTLFFPKNKESASASFSIWDPLGTSISYAMSRVICNKIAIIILISILILGFVLYMIVEHIEIKKMDQNKNEKKVNTEMETLKE